MPSPAPSSLIDELLGEQTLTTMFQPLVEIGSGAFLGVEALSRGPEGHPLERPDDMFALARAHQRTVELDWTSRICALRTTLAAGDMAGMTLFVNAEPEALLSTPPEAFEGLRREMSAAGVAVVLEITERHLSDQPAQLLAALGIVRHWGWKVALDDVGADPASLALLPFIAPDVVKLDLRLVQQRPTVEIAQIVNAVLAYAERTGVPILAEGIETDEHQRLAVAMGATLGQGWLYGRVGPMPHLDWQQLVLPDGDTPAPASTPWAQVVDSLPSRRSTKPLLVAMSSTLERQAIANGESAVVLASFQHARHFTPTMARRYASLAGTASLVGVFADQMATHPCEGVRGSCIPSDDPLASEWVVVVLGPHIAAALVAHDLGDSGPAAERRFDFTLTYDRQVVTAVACSLMRYVEPIHQSALEAPPVSLPDGPRVPTPGPDVLRQAVEACQMGITIAEADNDQPLTYVNPAFERLTGYLAEEVLGRNCRFLQGPLTDPASVVALEQGIRLERPVAVRLRNLRADGSYFWNDVRIAPVRDARGRVTHILGLQNDVTAQVDAEQRLVELVEYDELTGLRNRRGLLSRLEEELARSRRAATSTGLLFLSLRGFRTINATFGREQGDAVLREVAVRLASAVEPSDVLARVGADAFAVLLPGLREAQGARDRALDVTRRMRAVLEPPVLLAAAAVEVSARSGYAMFPSDGLNADQLVAAAEERAQADAPSPGG